MSTEIQYPFFSSNLTSQLQQCSSDNSKTNNVLVFKQVPDYTGVGKVQVTVKGYNDIKNYSLLIYLIQESDIDTNTLTFVNQIKCSSSDLYKCDTNPSPACSYFAILVETSKIGNSPTKNLNTKDILHVPGYIDFISSAPYASGDQIQLIENGVKKWVQEEASETFNNHDVESSTPVFPTNVNDFTNQLVKDGVPKNYFTQEVKFVLQLVINEANVNAKQLLKAARASGSMTTEIQLPTEELGATSSWKCKFCKVGFAVTVAIVSVTIAAVIVPLLPEIGVATAALAGYLQTWFSLSAATATLVAGSVSTSLVQVAKNAVVKVKDVALILPQALCENLGACQKSS